MNKYKNIVNIMRKNKSNIQLVKKEQNILYKCILCKSLLPSTQWSILLENTIKEKFNIKKKINCDSGDGSINGKYIEIKVSLGSSDGQINFVQLRPGHNIDYYLFLVYNLHEGDLGKVYWFLCKPYELYKLLPEYGGYAHGTVKKLGKITLENINLFKQYEYSLRPNPIKNGKSKKLWNELLVFNKTEKEIKQQLNL